jgi:hypothetical protein
MKTSTRQPRLNGTTAATGQAPGSPAPNPAPDQGPQGPKIAPEHALLWSLEEAAAALRVSGRTLKRMESAQELPPGAVVRLSRRRLFSSEILRKWCAAGCPRVATPRPGRKRR